MTDSNTAMTTIDTVEPNINPVELMARLEPEQQLQLFEIKQGIFLQEHRRQTALELENHRSRNSWMLAGQEHQNKLAQIQYQADREDQRAAMKDQAAVTLANKEHENKVERMQKPYRFGRV
jgi:hypothetical protein